MKEKIFKLLIKSNPRNLLKYLEDKKISYYDKEKMIKYALDCGYIPTDEDLKRSKSLSSSHEMELEINHEYPELKKYFIFDYTSPYMNLEMKKKIDEFFEDSVKRVFFNNLIEEYPILLNVIKKPVDELTVRDAFEKGYVPSLEVVKNNNILCSISEIFFKILTKDNIDIFRYYTGNDEALFSYALSLGYPLKGSDLLKNNFTTSDVIMRKFIDMDCNNIIYYHGSNEEIFKYAISKGFVITEEFFRENRISFASSDVIMLKMIEIDPNYIFYYTSYNDEVIKNAYDRLSNKEVKRLMKIEHFNFSRSEFLLKKALLGDPNKGLSPDQSLISRFDLNSANMLILAIENGYMPNKNDLENSLLSLKDWLIIVDKYPQMIEYFHAWHLADSVNLIKIAISKGYHPSEDVLDRFLPPMPADIDVIIYAHSNGYIPNTDNLKTIFKYLDNPYNFDIVKENTYNTTLFKLAIERFGYIPQIDEINHVNIDVINPDLLVELMLKDENAYILSNMSNENLISITQKLSIDSLIKIFIYSGSNNMFYSMDKKTNILWKRIEEVFKSKNIDYNLLFRNKEFDYSDFFAYIQPEIFDEIIKNVNNDNKVLIAIDLLKKRLDDNTLKKFNTIYNDISVNNLVANLVNELSKDDNINRVVNIPNLLFEIMLSRFDYIGLCNTLKALSSHHMDYNTEKKFLLTWKQIDSLSKNISEEQKDYFSKIKIEIIKGDLPKEIFTQIINSSDYDSLVTIFVNLSKQPREDEYEILWNKVKELKMEKKIISDSANLLKKDIKNVPTYILDLLIEEMDTDSLKEAFISIKSLDYKYLLWEKMFKKLNKNVSSKYCEMILDLNPKTIKDFIDVFPGEEKFFEDFEVSFESFSKYAIVLLDDVIELYKTNKVKEFNLVYEYFVNNGFINNEEAELFKVRNTFKLLGNYLKNPSIYNQIVKLDNLTFEEKKRIKDSLAFLSIASIDDSSIKTIDELLNIKTYYLDKCKMEIDESKNIDELKNVVCKLMFNMTLDEATKKLKIYGNVESFKITSFNNRDNKEIQGDILDIIYLVKVIEDVIYCNDEDALREFSNKVLLNYDEVFNTLSFYSNYDEIMRDFYEKELVSSTTKIKELSKEDLMPLLDKQMSDKIGVDVLDFSDKQYCLLEHKVSNKENLKDLVSGNDKSSMITICLSVGSNRNQFLYYGPDGMVLATDTLPNGRFIRSSANNMGSNNTVKDVLNDRGKNFSRKQRGALEISETTNSNSEVLCYRDGVTFKYIVLLGGRMPTAKEIQYAKEYNLKFVKVQEHDKTIANPKKIDNNYLIKDGFDLNDKESKKKVDETLLKSKKRKIAIFTDSHALYEPTLAVLEDARKNGIDEIYSLGDNIGSGPSPKEVLELLDEYKVKSVQGNHELYALGLDKLSEELKEHLLQTNSEKEAIRNSEYTRGQLTEKQLSDISNYPDSRVIQIGGKKIYLTHYSKSYDSNLGDKSIPEDVSEVFQGHIHMPSKHQKDNKQITTVGGLGIRQNLSSPKAYYLVLSETEDGYEVEVKEVAYDSKNLYHTINESNLPLEDKEKIERWSKVKR